MTFIGSTRPEIDRGPVPRIARVGSRGLAKPARHGRMLPLARLVACVTVLASRLAGAQCGSSAVPIERVQEASATTSAGATSLSLAWPAPTAAGNFLVLAVHVLWNSTVGDIGVPPGWTLAERADNVGFDDVTVALYYREHAPSQSGVVTVTALDAEDRIKMVLAEYRGIVASGSLDKHAHGVGMSATASSGSTAPTAQPGELWLGAIASASGLSQCGPTNGFGEVAMPVSGASTLGLYDRVAGSSGPAGLSVTLSPFCGTAETFSLPWSGVVATFRTAAGSAPQACAPMQIENCVVTTRFVGIPDGDRYYVRCRVQLDGTSNGIDPVAEGIRFMLTDRDSPVCAGACLDATVTPYRVGRCWRYAIDTTGPRAVRSLRLCDIDPQRGTYQLFARSRHANLQCLNGPRPYTVDLSIGDDCSAPCAAMTTTTTTTTIPTVCPADGVPDPAAENVVLDCQEGGVYSRVGSSVGGRELDVLGIYESRSDHSAGNHPTGEATVRVDRPGPVVLVLSSYEPTHWTIAVMPGAAVERIVLNGYYQQTASAPAGIPIDDRSSYQSWLGSYGYAWPDNTGGGNTANLIMRSEGLAGTCLASFHGCYRATQFSLGAPAPSTGWTAFAFQSAPTVQTPCTGPRYIRYLPAYDEWVGVSLC